jgi:hypothetical protein
VLGDDHPFAAAALDGRAVERIGAVASGCILAPMIGSAGFTLSGPFGAASYNSLGQVLAALRARAFQPESTSPRASSAHQPAQLPQGPSPAAPGSVAA